MPLWLSNELVDLFKTEKRTAVAQLLTEVRTYVRTCSTSCPNSTDPHYVSEGIPLNETQQINIVRVTHSVRMSQRHDAVVNRTRRFTQPIVDCRTYRICTS